MTAPKIGRMVVRSAASYNAAAYIFEHGPQTPEQLYAVADFGHKMTHKQDKLDRALANGWLVQGSDGKIDIGTIARAHFASESEEGVEQDGKPIGQIATPRQQSSVFARPPLNKRHIPNPRGTRQDIPGWSVRPAGFSLKSVSGGEA